MSTFDLFILPTILIKQVKSCLFLVDLQGLILFAAFLIFLDWFDKERSEIFDLLRFEVQQL